MYGQWKELCRLWDELGVLDLLRKDTPSGNLYLLDRMVGLIRAIDQGRETDGDDSGWLVSDEDRPR